MAPVGKEQIQEAIFEEHYRTMIVQFETSKKLKDIKHDNFRQIQGYFNDKNLTNARLKFKIHAKMVDNIPGNFKININTMRKVLIVQNVR